MALTDEEMAELLNKVRDIHAAVEAGFVVTLAPDDREAIVDEVDQRVSPKMQPAVRNALFTLQMNVPVPAGVATFSPKPPSGT